MKLTLYRYIFNEVWPTFFACLFVSVFVIVAGQMVQITELIVNREVYFGYVLRMMVYMMPDIVGFILPAASLMAVLIAFLRLSADNEIIALKSSGISLYQMLVPVVILSIAGLLASASIGTIAAPWGNKSFKDLLFQIGQSKADLGVKERVFCEPFDHVVFYVSSFSSRDRVMRDVFVVDMRDKKITNTIIAKKAWLLAHPEHSIITLRFGKGNILVVDRKTKSGRSIKFDTYDLNIGLKDIMASLSERRKTPKEFYMYELIEELKIMRNRKFKFNEQMTQLWEKFSIELNIGLKDIMTSLPEKRKTPKEFHMHKLIEQVKRMQNWKLKFNELMTQFLEKFSIPIAVFLMGIIGVPLGAQLREAGRSFGIGVSLAVFAIYYMCLAGTRSACETGIIDPKVGVWIPDIFLLFSCVYLLRLSAKERTIRFLSKYFIKEAIGSKILRIRRGWSGKHEADSLGNSGQSY